MSTEQADRILSKAEAAQYISMSESFIHAHATRKNKAPRLACIKIGNRLKFRKSSLDAFIQEYADKTAAKKVE
jgi:predicted DNA-binding transcriptional regulator AlpA